MMRSRVAGGLDLERGRAPENLEDICCGGVWELQRLDGGMRLV